MQIAGEERYVFRMVSLTSALGDGRFPLAQELPRTVVLRAANCK